MFKKAFSSIVFSLGVMIMAVNNCSAKYLEIIISPDIYVYEKNDGGQIVEGILDICVQHMSQYPDELRDMCEKAKDGHIIKKISDSFVQYNHLKDLSRRMQRLNWLSIQKMEEFQCNGCILDESVYSDLDCFPKIQRDFLGILLKIFHIGNPTVF